MPGMPQIESTNEAPKAVPCDVLLVGAFASDEGVELPEAARGVDEALGGLLGRLTATGFKAKPGELAKVPGGEGVAGKSVAVLGLGPQDKLDGVALRRAAGSAGRRLADHDSIAVALPLATDEDASAAVEGLLLGSYRFTTYKSDPRPTKIETITIVGRDADGASRGAVKASATLLARDLTNEPASTLTPTLLAERAKEVARANDLVAKIWGRAELEERGFGGLLGVSQGSEQDPRFIQLRYVPQSPRGKVVLVGKGVTYDTGGYSLKPPASMEQMKTDMAGGAAVIGTMSVLARLGIDLEVIALIPATENLVSGKAVKPGDVLRHYGGKTTEVMNTDAEGRLILADALAFASEQEPDAIVDLATLTGSMTVALGKKASGVFSNDDDLQAELQAASKAAGELMWPMPLWAEQKSELDSEVADYRNVGSRYGGAITAAVFLGEFVKPGIPWAHMDIAGPARADSDRDEVSKGGTGVGVRTLIEWLERRCA